jgi:hypothetical protein
MRTCAPFIALSITPSATQSSALQTHHEPATQAPGDVHIELRRGASTVSVHWPHCSGGQMCWLVVPVAAMIRIDAAWFASASLDMRAGTDTALTRVVAVFGATQPHHAYFFANKRARRLKVLVHDGIGI